MIKLLSALSGGWLGPALVAAALAAGGAWHIWAVHDARKEGDTAGAARVQALWDAAKAQAQAAAASAAAEYRATEQRRADAARREIDDAHTRLSAAVADAGRAAAAADGLRNAATARRCPAANHPATAASGPAAASTGDLFSDVLGSLGDRATALAAEADRRGVAGAACERIYESLTPTKGKP